MEDIIPRSITSLILAIDTEELRAKWSFGRWIENDTIREATFNYASCSVENLVELRQVYAQRLRRTSHAEAKAPCLLYAEHACFYLRYTCCAMKRAVGSNFAYLRRHEGGAFATILLLRYRSPLGSLDTTIQPTLFRFDANKDTTLPRYTTILLFR